MDIYKYARHDRIITYFLDLYDNFESKWSIQLWKYFAENIKSIGTEPKEADDAFKSLMAGYIIENKTTNTIADGLRTTIREKTFGILKENLDEIYTVSENEIIDAMRIIWEKQKIIIEPSCAVPFAALLQQKDRFKGQRIGIIITGGNVDFKNLPFV